MRLAQVSPLQLRFRRRWSSPWTGAADTTVPKQTYAVDHALSIAETYELHVVAGPIKNHVHIISYTAFLLSDRTLRYGHHLSPNQRNPKANIRRRSPAP